MRKEKKVFFNMTETGFEWGPVTVVRADADDEDEAVVLTLETKKSGGPIHIYVTPSGRISFYSRKKLKTELVQ
jgi:hypothetical protein